MLVLSVLMTAVALGTAAGMKMADKPVDDLAVVATVNGEPVTADWFSRVMFMQRASVHSYFADKYGEVAEDSSFWNTSYNGEKPIDVLRSKALEKCVETKIQQIWLKERGLLDTIDYQSFRRVFQSENERRKQAANEGRAVYGTKQFDEATFFDVYYNDLFHKLKPLVVKITDEDLSAYYEQKKHILFVEDYDYEIEVWSSAGDSTTLEERAATERTMAEVRDEVIRQGALTNEKKALPDGGGGRFNYESKRLTKAGERDDRWSETGTLLRTMTESLREGEISELQWLEGKWYFIRCVAKRGPVFQSFESVKQSEKLQRLIINGKYRALLQEQADRAEVKIHPDVYGAIRMLAPET